MNVLGVIFFPLEPKKQRNKKKLTPDLRLNESTKGISTTGLYLLPDSATCINFYLKQHFFLTLSNLPIFRVGLFKVTRPSYFVRLPSYFEALWYTTFTLIASLTYSMDYIQINLQYSIKFLAIGVNVKWLQCHASLGSESKFCYCRYFFVKVSRLHIVRISALR